MGEKPQEEIIAQPKWGILEFGDGYIAMLQGGLPSVTIRDGKKIVEVIIKPHELLRKRYNIKDSDLDTNGNTKFQMSEDDLIPLNLFDDANRKWLYKKTYKHQETDLSNHEWVLTKRIEQERMKRVMIEGYLIHLSEQLQLAKNNPAEFLNQGFEYFVKMQESMSGFIKRKEEDK